MGLDTTHNCWHGPYSSFNSFRYDLARQIGVNLDDYAGYGKNGTIDISTIQHDIMPLLDHSDCEGDLSVEESKRISCGLNQILNNLNESKLKSNHPEYFKGKIVQFIEGLESAISKNEIVEFR